MILTAAFVFLSLFCTITAALMGVWNGASLAALCFMGCALFIAPLERKHIDSQGKNQ